MQIQWFDQISTKDEKCAQCHIIIKPFTNYFRATQSPDNLDSMGYNICSDCRITLPDTPEYKV
ncbi:MAG: hypothetical protein Q7R95_11220 [bacterium]|nr:hypothetical protein [bacterium]